MQTALLLAALAVAAPTPLRLSADVDDAYALKLNPAGLAFADGAQLRILFARHPLIPQADLGFYTALSFGGVVTIGSQLEIDAVSKSGATARPGFGIGIGGGRFGLGASWRTSDAGDLWGFGMTWRPARSLSLSFSSVDLAQKLGARPYDVGLGFRFFKERLLLSGQWRFHHGLPVRSDEGRPDVRVLLSVEPVPGVYIAGQTDLHARPSLQVGFSFDHFMLAGTIRGLREGDAEVGLAEIAFQSRALPTVMPTPKVAVLELAGDLLPPTRLNLIEGRFEVPVYGAVPLLLEELATADRIKGAVLKIGSLDLGWGRAEELRAGVERLVKVGKRVDCVLSAGSDLELFIASACSSVASIPTMPINVDGLAATLVFFGEGLDKLGVEPQVVARGEYKSAPETFTRSRMSPAHRETIDAVLDETWNVLVDGLSKGRSIPREEVEAIIAEGTLTPTAAKARRLVDDVIYPDEVDDWVRRQYGGSVTFIAATSLPRPTRNRWGRHRRIALVSVDAIITSGDSTDLPFGLGRQAGARTLLRVLEDTRIDPTIEAVVLRVDSPGGDAVASDLIAREVRLLAQAKPVVASFGDVAASGGYYVAAGARAIFAERTSITGSIGIFSLGFSVEPLLAKLGIHTDIVALGEGATRGGVLRSWTPEEKAITEREVDALYAQFLRIVSEGRKLGPEEVKKHAEGRVWTGAAAKERGLVDEIGGLVEAIARARLEAGILEQEDVEILVLPRSRPSLPEVVRGVFGLENPTDVALVPHALRGLARVLLALATAPSARGAALLPFTLRVD